MKSNYIIYIIYILLFLFPLNINHAYSQNSQYCPPPTINNPNPCVEFNNNILKKNFSPSITNKMYNFDYSTSKNNNYEYNYWKNKNFIINKGTIYNEQNNIIINSKDLYQNQY